jgi:hypothetical protein
MSNQFNFNLKLEDYNEQELEDLFNLKYPYSTEDIQKCKTNIQTKLLQDKNLKKNKQQDINNFLENSSQQLVRHIMNRHESYGYPREHITSFLDGKNKIIQQDNNIIIEPPDRLVGLNSSIINGRTVNSKDAPPGAINPLNIRTVKKAINIDSRFRPDYYQSKSTDYLMTLPTRISKVVSMRVSSLQMPLTYYAISKAQGNNTFVVKWEEGGFGFTSERSVVHLPDGNYEVKFSDSLHAFHIEKAVQDAMIQANIPSTIGYTVDHISGKSVFAQNQKEIVSPPIPPFEILFNVDTDGNEDNTTSLQFRLGWQLGFRTSKYVSQNPNNTATGKWGAIVSEGLCFPMGSKYAYLGINDFNNNVNDYFVGIFTSSIFNKNIISRINLVKGIQNKGVSHSLDDEGSSTQLNRTRNFFGPVNIEKLKITLYDEYGRIIDLNNMDWSFTLSFDCLYN